MSDKEFQKLLDQTVAAGRKHHDLMARCREEMHRRYGLDHNEASSEYLIDSLDYCNGRGVSVEMVRKELEGAERVW